MLRKIFQSWESPKNKDLIGKWKLDPYDIESLQEYGNISLEFKSTGELIYIVYLNNKEQKIYMTYKIVDNLLITNQPSSPQVEQTNYVLQADGKLVLYFDGVKSVYIKMD